MRKRDFVLMTVLSATLAAGLVIVSLRWPSPPPAEARQAAPASAPGSTVAGDAQLTPEERVNIRIYSQASHSVVNVTSTRLALNFFLQVVPEQGSGSGFFVDDQGHILTNHHVIEDSRQVQVTLFDETTVDAEVIGMDPVTDIALLKIDCPPGKCPPLPLAAVDDLQVGQHVLAIGNPFGLERTLTTGVVSSVGRSLETENGVLDNLIQTDAAINPGNSGGPLLNTRGEVIGINTAIFSRTGENAGIGFAIPVSTIRRVLPDLLEYGAVQRPWIGIVRARTVTPRLAEILELPVQEGVLVEQVAEGSSAALAGIQGGNRRVWIGNVPLIIGGDVLVAMDGQPVRRVRDITQIAKDKRPGETMEFVYYRGNRRITQAVELVGREGVVRRFRF
ncbi:MAG: trypsin-like peptidase domain-containing protein [Acidobacteriota bacterium]